MYGRVFREKRGSGAIKLIAFIVVVVALLFLINKALGDLSGTQSDEQIQISQDAIIKAAVQCYALESSFPTGLQYLVDNYGVKLDYDKYNYHYVALGENLVPDVKVIAR